MSLRAFHIIFIFLAIALSLVCSWWSFSNGVALPFGIGCVLAAVALTVYGFFFIKKARKLVI
jgi:hypothetical protein